MKELRDITAHLEGELNSIPNPETTGAVLSGDVAPVASTRTRAVTVLVNNSDYLSWVLDNVGRNMLKTAHELSAFNPLKIGIAAMARFIRHPNAWKFLVHQVAETSDEAFDLYWPDVVKLMKEINGE
jgi:hypothetical protein